MNIANGIIRDKIIAGIPLNVDILEIKGKANARTGVAIRQPLYIVVHNTGNSSPTAGDEAHANYLRTVEAQDEKYLSWHFTVDADSITQHIPLTEHGWHAGDGGSGAGNRNGVGIEIAENKNYPLCEENGIKLIRALMEHFGVPLERVQPHRYFATNRKLCPWRILKSQKTWQEDWAAFQRRIGDVKGTVSAAPTSPGKVVYRVQAGAFSARAGANTHAVQLKANGFDSLVMADGPRWVVQAGAFSVKANADALVSKLKAAGIAAFVRR